jgi:hypothetical protein
LTNITSLNLDGSYNFNFDYSLAHYPTITHIGLLYLPKLTTLRLKYLTNLTFLDIVKNDCISDKGLKY